ncbi:MAG: hypothetical protein IJ086_15295 [Clostridium sp.]|nr:hypothetical protein [Clostridium sp.]MBQ9000041.1 hypothetical protein [Clostridium sp.]
MQNFKNLSFNNIKIEDSSLGGIVKISVIADTQECLAEARCKILNFKDFAYHCFYKELLNPEIQYVCSEFLSSEQYEYAKALAIENFMEYANENCCEDDISTLNYLYEKYDNLNKYILNNVSLQEAKCICIDNIESYYEKSYAGTLIVDYLKSNYLLIFIYGTWEAEEYWKKKACFKEILNGFMYYTDNIKLNEIM